MRWGVDDGVPATVKSSPWYSRLPSLQKTVLLYSLREKTPIDAIARDVSQNMGRIRYSTKTTNIDGIGPCPPRHVAPTQMPGQVMWLNLPTQPPRLQLGRESLILGGFPIAKVPSLVERTSEGTMMSLGGNMMSAPVLLALLVSIFESVAWRKTGPIPYQTDEAVHCAMNLFLASAPQGEVGELDGDDNAEPDQGHMCKRLKIDDL